ncbi:DNA cytosine methyltransferase [Enterobacter kobei]|uniref:DNA cytosine methyltransferase n=1 Tax=Enterobacter kobei TaxID=208224 RepID=UPI00388D8F31
MKTSIINGSEVSRLSVAIQTTPHALERFKKIQQGCNFHDLPLELKTTYSDSSRTQNTIYLRLKYNEPSGTVVNVRKSMWIHPIHDRALSIREAARLQTFPDSFVFYGVKDSQYQQIGNAVPPILAKALAQQLCSFLDHGIAAHPDTFSLSTNC